MTKDKVLWVRVEPGDFAAVVLAAKRYGVTPSEVLRALLKQARRVDVHGDVLPHGLYIPDPATATGAIEIDRAEADEQPTNVPPDEIPR